MIFQSFLMVFGWCLFSNAAAALGITLEDFRDLPLADFERFAEENNLTLVIEQQQANLPIGTVIEHLPAVGGMSGADGRVMVIVSEGIAIPTSLVGRPFREVVGQLETVGLSWQRTERSLRFPVGFVGGTLPPEGKLIDASNEVVTVLVSTTPLVPVPNVKGLNFEDARRTLLSVGFLATGEVDDSSGFGSCSVSNPRNIIDRTDPPAGKVVLQGSSIEMVEVIERVAVAAEFCQ